MRATNSIEKVYEFRRSRLEQAFEILERPRFQKKLQNRITKATYFHIDGFEFEYPAELPLDIEKQNRWAVSHKSDCPQYEAPLDVVSWYSFEADERFYELSREVAEKIWAESSLAKELLAAHQGLWVTALETAWRQMKDKPLIGTKPAPYPLFELLLPGFETWLDLQFRSNHPRIVESSRSGYSKRQQRESSYFIKSKVMEMALVNLTNFLEKCEHDYSVNCLMCDRKLEPNLRASVEWRFPRNLCARCVAISDYHRVELMEKGLDPELARKAQVDAAKLISKITERQLWELLPVDRYFFFGLNVAAKAKSEQVVLLKCLAALSIDNLWDTKYHLLDAAGLEQFVPKGRGRGIRSISSCGHLCLSEGERSICEELMRRGVPHEREPVYWQLLGAGATNGRAIFGEMRGDFLVGKQVLEFAGMHGQAAYDEKMKEKIRLCKLHGIDMQVLYPNDLKSLSTKFDELGI